MDEKECKVCTKMIKEKYKHYKTWKVLAIIFMCVAILFAILYFASGDLFTSTTIEYQNDVTIENGGNNNTNTDNGNIIVEKQNDSTGGVTVVCVIIIIGGLIVGCYIVSQKNNNNKE